MLLHNGFVLNNNSYDYTQITLGINTNDKLIKLKCDILANFGLKRYIIYF